MDSFRCEKQLTRNYRREHHLASYPCEVLLKIGDNLSSFKILNNYKLVLTAATFGFIFLFQNCGGGNNGFNTDLSTTAVQSSESAILSDNAMFVLNNRCVSCHNPSNPNGGIDYINVVNSLLFYRLVIPGDAPQSELYDAVVKGRMPPGNPLSNTEVKYLGDWIATGFDPNVAVTNPVGCTTLGPTFQCIRNVILTFKCGSCHMGTNAAGGVSFNTYISSLTAVPGKGPLVTANAPNSSLLYTSVANDSMPKNAGALSAAEKDAIFQWISNGALNN